MKDNLKNIIDRSFQEFSYEWVRNAGIPKPDSVEKYIRQFEINAAIFTVVNFKATKCSQVKPLVYQVVDAGAEREFRKMNGQSGLDAYEIKALRNARRRGLKEIELDKVRITDGELYTLKKLLTRPGGSQCRWDDFMYALSVFYDVVGWSLIKKNIEGKDLVGMNYLPTQYVQIEGGTPLVPIRGYTYNGDTNLVLTPDQCVPIRSFNIDINKSGSNLYGSSLVKSAWREIMTYNESKERQYSAFKTGDSAHLIFPRHQETELSLDDSESVGTLRKLKDQIFGALRQKDRHSAAVLGVAVDSVNLASTLDKAKTIETQQEIRDVIASIWSLPTRIVFNDARSATYNNMNEDKKNALFNGVFPFLMKVERALEQDIITEHFNNVKFTFDYDAYPEMKPNVVADMETIDKVSFLTDNEKRDMFDYEPLESKFGDIPAKYLHIDAQSNGRLPAGMTQGNGTFNRDDPRVEEEGYQNRTNNNQKRKDGE